MSGRRLQSERKEGEVGSEEGLWEGIAGCGHAGISDGVSKENSVWKGIYCAGHVDRGPVAEGVSTGEEGGEGEEDMRVTTTQKETIFTVLWLLFKMNILARGNLNEAYDILTTKDAPEDLEKWLLEEVRIHREPGVRR